MKARVIPLLERAIHEGLIIGWNNAYKRMENPDEETVVVAMKSAIMHSLYDYFSFDEREF